VCRKSANAFPERRKPGGSTRSLASGLDGGRNAHAIFSLDRKFIVPIVLAARDCHRWASAAEPFDCSPDCWTLVKRLKTQAPSA
jgi:hypothetical protein